MQMPIEQELGTLIRRMNPYTTGGRRSMLLESRGRAPFVAPANAAGYVTALTTAANAAHNAGDSARRAAVAVLAARGAGGPGVAQAALDELRQARDAFAAAMEEVAEAADSLIDLGHIDVVIDDFIANYSSADWVFRGQPQTVKRALRITYLYQARDTQQNLIPGVNATEHILVGYAGGNGSA